MAEKWEIWNEEEETVKLEKEAKKLIPPKFHRWIHVFRKKVSERMLVKKVWNHEIELKKEFVPRKRKRHSDLSFFLAKKTRTLCKEKVGQIKLITRFFLMNFFRASCLDAKRE